MNRTRHLTALAAAALSAVAALGVGSQVTGPARATGPVVGSAPVVLPPQAPPGRTALTVTVDGCEGCTVQLHQTLPGPRGRRYWESRKATVTGGRAVLDVPSRRTFASTMTLHAPWEGQLGYLTTVVMRYAGNHPGDPVSPAEAADSRRAYPCWEGTRQRRARLDLAVEQVAVGGVHGQVTGTRAWLSPTTVWTGDSRHAPRGVLGTQDFDVCGD